MVLKYKIHLDFSFMVPNLMCINFKCFSSGEHQFIEQYLSANQGT